MSARELFIAHALEPASEIAELRANLTQAKLEALQQVHGLDSERMRVIMPELYEQIVITTIQIAAHVGLSVGIALNTLDEQVSGASISRFSRDARQQMTDIGLALKRRHSSKLAHLVAEIEAQRLAWRHSHEFMSWLAFRRNDPRYPPDDRLQRLTAFKIRHRILQSRDAVTQLLGSSLTAAIEGSDRFLLANRWHLGSDTEQAIERAIWPILSLQPSVTVLIESARLDYDALVDAGADASQIETARSDITRLLQQQLADSLEHASVASMAVP